MPRSLSEIQRLWPAILTALLVVTVGTLDDWYSRSDYMTDAISYLDISKAIREGDWSLVFSPYWSIGYPLILAAIRGLFPNGPQGEWTAVHVVNLVIFVATYWSFIYLLRVAQAYLARASGGVESRAGDGFVLAIGTALFVVLQVVVWTISRVNPDLLVSCVFFLSTAILLQFSMRPRMRTAVLAGLLLGFGYVVKAIFLPLAAFLLLVPLLLAVTRAPTERRAVFLTLAWALPAMAVLALPIIVANSRAAGIFTLGETGALNYAWNVNHLPSVTHWQGGAGDGGRPIHATEEVSTSPHVFLFPEPFHVTYSPWFNPFYRYQGYHRYFRIGNEVDAVKTNLRFIEHFFLRGPVTFAAIFVVAVSLWFFRQRMMWWRRVAALWPLYLPSILAVGGYVLVVVEPRYLVGFWAILLTLPFVALFAPTPLLSRRAGYAVAIPVCLLAALVTVVNERETFRRAWDQETYLGSDQWKTALFLREIGLRPGDKVASVNCGMCCTWAKVSEARIVAEIPDLVDTALAPSDGARDIQLFAENPAVQETVFGLFRRAGATVVVMLDGGESVQGSGWMQVPGTDCWVHHL